MPSDAPPVEGMRERKGRKSWRIAGTEHIGSEATPTSHCITRRAKTTERWMPEEEDRFLSYTRAKARPSFYSPRPPRYAPCLGERVMARKAKRMEHHDAVILLSCLYATLLVPPRLPNEENKKRERPLRRKQWWRAVIAGNRFPPWAVMCMRVIAINAL